MITKDRCCFESAYKECPWRVKKTKRKPAQPLPEFNGDLVDLNLKNCRVRQF